MQVLLFAVAFEGRDVVELLVFGLLFAFLEFLFDVRLLEWLFLGCANVHFNYNTEAIYRILA